MIKKQSKKDAMDSKTANMMLFYEKFPYTNLPISQGRIVGGWFLNFSHAYYDVTRRFKPVKGAKILDAGCGAGDITVILALNNPGAAITAIDLSKEALKKAEELARRHNAANITFKQVNILEYTAREEFDFIMSSGVVHHLADPAQGLGRLQRALRPDGIMLLFLYSMYGRWEIGIIQELLGLLSESEEFQEREDIVRKLMSELEPENPLVRFYNRPSMAMNQEGSYFTDMYINPIEQRYNVYTLLDLLEKAGLEFSHFLEKQFWKPQAHLKDPQLIKKAASLPLKQRLHLIELLRPDIMGYTFSAYKKGYSPLSPQRTQEQLLGTYPLVNPAAFINEGIIQLGPLQARAKAGNIDLSCECRGDRTVREIISGYGLGDDLLSTFLKLLAVMEDNRVILLLEKPFKDY